MNRAEFIIKTVTDAASNDMIHVDDVVRILGSVASILNGPGTAAEIDTSPGITELWEEVNKRFGVGEPYFVVCRTDSKSEVNTGTYVLATSRRFSSEDGAYAYARGISPSRDPLVLKVHGPKP